MAEEIVDEAWNEALGEANGDDDIGAAEEGQVHGEVRGPKRKRNEPKLPLSEEFSVGKDASAEWADTGTRCDGRDHEDEPTGCCNCLSAFVCGKLFRAKRLGNMSVLWSTRTSDGRTKLHCLVGPFWPCLAFVTYPLVFGCSLVVAVLYLPDKPIFIQAFWWACTLMLIASLGCTGCRNPGVVRRWKSKPDDCSHWIWSDQGGTYRPPRARYDGDCAVVIEEFDHTCPWTGTGIGRRNMPAFQTFLCSLCVCLMVDAMLVGGALDGF